MSDFFTLNDSEALFLEAYGAVSQDSPERPLTLVALHGLGGGGYFFAGIGRSLAPRARLFSPDMPGSGFSRRGDQPISFDRFADVVVQLIERKTSGPVALLGHSMGTITALKVYARIPERIGSMIFVGGLPAPLPEVQVRLRGLAALARSEGMAAVAATVVPVVFAHRSLDAIPDKVAMFQRLLAHSDLEGYAGTALALADASATNVIPRVRVPCLCVTGSEDRYAPPAAVRALADTIPFAVYRELADCGHMPFFEAPDVFGDIVQSFLCEAE
jgi:3-oxoadipate enol-lactonase